MADRELSLLAPSGKFALGLLPDGILRPLRTALFFAVVYVVLCMVYIWVSGMVAAGVAGSVRELEILERVKGLAFVLVTGGGCSS